MVQRFIAAQADKALNNDGDLGVPYWDWTRLELNGQILCHGCCWGSALRNPRDTNNGEKNISENISYTSIPRDYTTKNIQWGRKTSINAQMGGIKNV